MQADSTYWETLIGKQLSGNATSDEKIEIAQWLNESPDHKVIYDNLKRIWNQTEPAIEMSQAEIDSDWINIEKQITTNSSTSVRLLSMTPKFKWLSIAAIGLLTILAGGVIYQQLSKQLDEPLIVQADERSSTQHMLPDGSIIWINQGSQISYDPEFIRREISLEGEAFFDVEKDPDRPFIVLAGESKTTVLGTRFNLKVNQNEGSVDLFVEEGRVAFSAQNRTTEATIVQLGQAASLDSESLAIVKIPKGDKNQMSWKSKQLHFDHLELGYVIQTLEDYFGIDMEVSHPGIMNCDFKSTFINPTIQEVLQTIEFSLNAKIEQNNQTYLITAQPCIE